MQFTLQRWQLLVWYPFSYKKFYKNAPFATAKGAFSPRLQGFSLQKAGKLL
jgi:hypothetical protein